MDQFYAKRLNVPIDDPRNIRSTRYVFEKIIFEYQFHQFQNVTWDTNWEKGD